MLPQPQTKLRVKLDARSVWLSIYYPFPDIIYWSNFDNDIFVYYVFKKKIGCPLSPASYLSTKYGYLYFDKNTKAAFKRYFTNCYSDQMYKVYYKYKRPIYKFFSSTPSHFVINSWELSPVEGYCDVVKDGYWFPSLTQINGLEFSAWQETIEKYGIILYPKSVTYDIAMGMPCNNCNDIVKAKTYLECIKKLRRYINVEPDKIYEEVKDCLNKKLFDAVDKAVYIFNQWQLNNVWSIIAEQFDYYGNPIGNAFELEPVIGIDTLKSYLSSQSVHIITPSFVFQDEFAKRYCQQL